MPRFRLTLAYDGTDFAGSQIQPGVRTVQGELDRAIRALGDATAVTEFAGRTDRGVHAAGQVVAVTFPGWRADSASFAKGLKAKLPGDIAVLDVVECDDRFSPRFDALWREYRYWIASGAVDPFLQRVCWMPRAEVDAEAVTGGARFLLGTHDFASFAGGGEGVPWSERARRPRGAVRTMLRCECRRIELAPGPGRARPVSAVEIRAAADGFLPRMVRNLVGALVEVGQGRREPEWIEEILAARDRRQGSVLAPAQGLTFWRAGFGGDVLDDW